MLVVVPGLHPTAVAQAQMGPGMPGPGMGRPGGSGGAPGMMGRPGGMGGPGMMGPMGRGTPGMMGASGGAMGVQGTTGGAGAQAAPAAAAPKVVQKPLEPSRKNPFQPLAPGATALEHVNLPGVRSYGLSWSRYPVGMTVTNLPRPTRPGPQPLPPAPPAPQTFMRVSSIGWAGGQALASYELPDGKTGVVRPGDHIGKWVVTDILRDRIRIKDPKTGEVQEVYLRPKQQTGASTRRQGYGYPGQMRAPGMMPGRGMMPGAGMMPGRGMMPGAGMTPGAGMRPGQGMRQGRGTDQGARQGGRRQARARRGEGRVTQRLVANGH